VTVLVGGASDSGMILETHGHSHLLTSLAGSFETSALLSVDSSNFQEQLAFRSEGIKKVISSIYSRSPAASPEVQSLQKRVNELLAQEKGHINECQRLNEEMEQLNKRLDDAAFRYMVAERKLDRVKSNAVANIEKQGALAASIKQEPEENVNGEPMNGVQSESTVVVSEEAERERAEAVAITTKVKEQLAQLEGQNAKLTTELTTAKARLDSLTDEDYAGTELFKIMKSQLEESLNKINDLEATHIQLREEAKKAQAERSAYRTKIDDEALTTTSSTEQLLAARDADLQRVRAGRDDLSFKLDAFKILVHERKGTVDAATALASAREDRINALENELERLRTRCGDLHAEVSEEEAAMEDVSELRQKVADLRKECKTLEGELPSIEQAYKKAAAAAAAKYAGYEKMDEQFANIKGAKSKSDHRFYGMMKYKEQLEAEVATLRKAEKTSSGIITSLKDADAKTKDLVVNLERQSAEHMDVIERMNQDRFGLEQKANQASMAATGFQKQVLQLKEALSEKDSVFSASESSLRESQREVEALKARLQDQTKQTKEWKAKAGSNDSDEVVRLRVSSILKVVTCSILTNVTASRILCLQPRSQKHRHHRLRSYCLQGMRQRPYPDSAAQMPHLHEGLWQQRLHARPSGLSICWH
jgi:E3 ubiquitin-protein ligase BRE1